jgi:hypothetical protein
MHHIEPSAQPADIEIVLQQPLGDVGVAEGSSERDQKRDIRIKFSQEVDGDDRAQGMPDDDDGAS